MQRAKDSFMGMEGMEENLPVLEDMFAMLKQNF